MTDERNQNANPQSEEYALHSALPNKPGVDFKILLLVFLAVFQFFLLWSAMSKMLGGSDTLALFTSLSISLVAVVCGFTLNHLAVTRGAELSALNFKSVQLLSIVGIIAIGFAISSATITGNVKDTVGIIQLQEHHASTAETVATKNNGAIQATQAVPVLFAITSDLAAKVECERLSACLSESGLPGIGPITRLLVEKSARAQNISDILADGEIARQESLERMNELMGEYQGALDNDELSFREKRSALQKIYSQIVTEGATLDNAIPKSLLFAYANELQGKVELKGRPVASRNVDAVLNGHGKALQRVLESIEEEAARYAPFPKSASLADVLSYIAYYWPFAAVVYGAEVGLPLMLFFVTYARLYWVIHTEHGANPPAKPRDDAADFRKLLQSQRKPTSKPNSFAVAQNEHPAPRKVGRPRKPKSNGVSQDGMNG
ncbi:hypothetical protein [Maritalea sp.]|jgi:hypothetical protein|uniref:hypothetical protein n=1 Tax=Maritalea sp. TaxID=2003361 RepID=UPI0039E64CD9